MPTFANPTVAMTTVIDDDLTAGPAALHASVRIADDRWQRHDPVALADMVLTTLSVSPQAPRCAASSDILFANDDTLADLNLRFRSKEGATNVLSFPSGEECLPGASCFLGGIALAFEQTEREASERGIPFPHHVTHLTLHGLLHLLGYDHERDDEREEMERIEIDLLGGLGIPNPYEGS
jgi:probable rRNA maturation factor